MNTQELLNEIQDIKSWLTQIEYEFKFNSELSFTEKNNVKFALDETRKTYIYRLEQLVDQLINNQIKKVA